MESVTFQPYGPGRLDESAVRRLYADSDAAHDFDHVLRVVRLGVRIARAEGADEEVVRAAALLHDLSQGDREGRKAHHLAAAEYAAECLRQGGMTEERIGNVVHCIQAHRFRDRSTQPQTLEAKCLYDADKLDCIGATGVGRAFAYAGARNNRLWTQPLADAPHPDEQPAGGDYTPLHEYAYKLRHVLSSLYTPTARGIGERRHGFMRRFFEQLDAEMAGES